ncbi:Peptidyl-prolyl cis-trans isomerase CYP18-1 [Bienertia sinuspersici]
MANSGANTNGSQFFMTYAKQPHLNGLYTVFGKVIHGFEVLDHMEKATITKAQTYKDNKDVNQ